MITGVRGDVAWQDADQARTVAFNVSGRYVTLTVEIVLGLLMFMPVAVLGPIAEHLALR